MKINTKNKSIVLALISMAALVSCGNSNNSSTPTVTEIEWWVPCGDVSDGNNAIYNYITKVANQFNETNNGNIHLTITSKGSKNNDYSGTAKAVSDALNGGQTPSMVTTYGTYVADWRKASPSSVADVTAHGRLLEADSDFNADYLNVEKQQYDGASYYSLPYSKSGEFLQYNVEAFNAVGSAPAGAPTEAGYPAPSARAEKVAYSVPTSFTEMMDLARQIKTDYPAIEWGRGEDGYYKAVPVIYESVTNLFYTVMESAGIPVMDAKAASLTDSVPFLNDARAKEVMKQLKKWSNEGLISTSKQLPMRNASSHEYPATLVGKGTAFVMITSTANAPYDAAEGYSIGFSRVPKWDATSSYKTLSQGPSVAFFNHGNEKEVEASLTFYDFLTNAANSAELALSTYYYPTRTSSYEVEGIKKAVEDSKKTVTYETEYATKQSAYLGSSLALNADIAAHNEYFMSPVNELSSKVRTGITGIVDNLFNDVAATSDADIEALIDAQFTAAKGVIFA